MADPKIAALEISNLNVRLKGRDILKDITLGLEPGKLCVVIGPNGAGKSTLLRTVAGLIRPESGTVLIDGHDIKGLGASALATHLAYLPQDRVIAWDLSATEVAALGGLWMAPDLARARAMKALAKLGLEAQKDEPVSRLSGGQRARVLLARLMVSDTKLWLLDEPLTALDPAWQRRVLDRLRRHAEEGGSVLISLHDLDLASRFADHLILMHEGRVIAMGTPKDVLTRDHLARVFELEGQFEDAQLRLSTRPL